MILKKKLENKKDEFKPEEKQFFMNYPLFCNDIAKRVNSFSNHIQCETKKLIEDIQKAKKFKKIYYVQKERKLKKKNVSKKVKVLKENLYIMVVFVRDAKWNQLLEIDINVLFVMTLIIVMLVKKN